MFLTFSVRLQRRIWAMFWMDNKWINLSRPSSKTQILSKKLQHLLIKFKEQIWNNYVLMPTRCLLSFSKNTNENKPQVFDYILLHWNFDISRRERKKDRWIDREREGERERERWGHLKFGLSFMKESILRAFTSFHIISKPSFCIIKNQSSF